MATKTNFKITISKILLIALVASAVISEPPKRLLDNDDYDDNNPDPPELDPNDFQPIFLNVLLAEGAKVPKNPFFDLPFDDTFGHDHLTPIGENQMYNLGTAILTKYKELFRDVDNEKDPIIPGNIYKAWSDSNPACQSTAISFLTGIFPPGFKRPEISSPWFSYTKKPPYNNPSRDPYDPNLENNASLPLSKPPIFKLRMDSDD